MTLPRPRLTTANLELLERHLAAMALNHAGTNPGRSFKRIHEWAWAELEHRRAEPEPEPLTNGQGEET